MDVPSTVDRAEGAPNAFGGDTSQTRQRPRRQSKGLAISEITIGGAATPFELVGALQEVDERTPALRLAIQLSLSHFHGDFRYSAPNTWIDCHSLDRFLDSLQDVAQAHDGEALLSDLSGEFNLMISNAGGVYAITFGVLLRDAGLEQTSFQSNRRIDREIAEQAYRQFKNMPRWW